MSWSNLRILTFRLLVTIMLLFVNSESFFYDPFPQKKDYCEPVKIVVLVALMMMHTNNSTTYLSSKLYPWLGSLMQSGSYTPTAITQKTVNFWAQLASLIFYYLENFFSENIHVKASSTCQILRHFLLKKGEILAWKQRDL